MWSSLRLHGQQPCGGAHGPRALAGTGAVALQSGGLWAEVYPLPPPGPCLQVAFLGAPSHLDGTELLGWVLLVEGAGLSRLAVCVPARKAGPGPRLTCLLMSLGSGLLSRGSRRGCSVMGGADGEHSSQPEAHPGHRGVG